MPVEKATEADLAEVLRWLEQEYNEAGYGFWSNEGIIRRALEDDELWVIRHGDTVVAFQVGNHSPDIACVRSDFQRQGLGTELFLASLARAERDDVTVLQGECSPKTSLPFWEKHGFERFGRLDEYSAVKVRRILHKDWELPAEVPVVDVRISFYDERALYEEGIEPFVVHKIRGAMFDDGEVSLDRRVIAANGDRPGGNDLVVKIEVDGVERCFSKAKHEQAQNAGVEYDRKGSAF